MPTSRRNAIPILYTSGTHYEVGFDVGRTFRGLIEDFLSGFKYLHEDLLPAYNTERGRAAYEACLSSLNEIYPQYVRELRGTAEGAKVPFHHLMLLHMDQMIPKAAGTKCSATCGCSTICCNTENEVILGHTEDALPETSDHVYIVSAHIKEPYEQGRFKSNHEGFTAYCYAGHLPGFCMGYNHHGLVFSVNVIFPEKNATGKTPRHFIARALLAAESLVEAQEILRNRGVGCSDGASFNMIFANQEGSHLFHNAEIGPALDETESPLSMLTISPGEHFMHANGFQRLEINQDDIELESSRRRLARAKAIIGFEPLTSKVVLDILSDTGDADFPIFREGDGPDPIKTITVGIFDILGKTWTLWMKNPKTSEPIATLPLVFKWQK